ncbi:SAM-dependent methyltransferase [Thermomonospora curvata]|uniref:SAM-dependent methyltransferase n=1 Tax=Thermomonospora curvata TaxID=2020 RepID=UPI001FE0507B|nr:SAM-dependent methyltransferase [Thermomonospora curvata]
MRTDIPSPARGYGWMLGGKDNYEADRQFVRQMLKNLPEALDAARENRLFLYRVVRHLAAEAGIRQFIDMGCGLPTDNNVHQVAQRFAPDSRVVYVDIDPIVLAHGRALLADDDSTTVIRADIRQVEEILDHPETKRLIDFDEPVAVLFLSVGHMLPDKDDPRRILQTVIDRIAPGGYIAFTQATSDDPAHRALMNSQLSAYGLTWQTRSPQEVQALLAGLEPVAPGLVDVNDWRPDPDQPPLPPRPRRAEALRRRLQAQQGRLRVRRPAAQARLITGPWQAHGGAGRAKARRRHRRLAERTRWMRFTAPDGRTSPEGG